MNRFLLKALVCVTTWLGVGLGNAFAQTSDALTPCDTTVWFVNVYPGSIFYELEGHSAIRIKTCQADIAVNYGMFSFDSPNFLYRFVKGETDYMVGAYPWAQFEYEYKSSGRRIVSRELNMNSEQKEKLIRLIENNLRPENRVYRYNYVLDNCATRPLRMVELAIGDTILLGTPAMAPDLTTFRNYMRHYHRNYSWYQFGIDLALGNGIDRPIDNREKSFAPVVLDDQLSTARIGSTEGPLLVVETDVLNDTAPDGCIEAPTPWWFSPTFVMWTLAIVCGWYAISRAYKRRKFARFLASITFGLYGIAGLLIAFLVFISVHESTSPNVNLLWLNPLCLIPVVTLWFRGLVRFNCWYFLFNFVMLLAVLVLWTIGYQSPNAAFIPMVLFGLLLSGLYLALNGGSTKILKIVSKN